MNFNVNHPLLYGLAALIIGFVLIQSCFFLIIAWRRARQLGITEDKLGKVVKSSAVFSFAPALAILIGMITLSKFLGLPLPWLRLSVLGALTYELPAAGSVATILDLPLDVTLGDAKAYAAIAWVMTLGILAGIIIIILFQKRMQMRLQKLKEKDDSWNQILMDSLFIGMIAAFLGMIFGSISEGLSGWIPVFVMLFSALIMLSLGLLIRKFKIAWLENYALPFSMMAGMIFAIPLSALIEKL